MADEAGSLQRHLQITLDDTFDISAYKRRVEISTNVRDVAVKVVDASASSSFVITNGSVRTLFQGLRDLKKLKSLSFESKDEKKPGTVLIQTLTAAVTHAHNLKDLYIGNVTLEGFSDKQIAAFTNCLRRRQSLEEFVLVGCKFAAAARTPYLDPLVRRLVDLPQLRVVHLQATAIDSLGTLSSAAVSALFQCKTLKELKLYQFDLTDDQFMTATRAMETGKRLEELSLGSCNFTIVTSSALAKMLRRNSALKVLELTPKKSIEEKLLIQIAEALEENTSLSHFAIDGDFGPITEPTKDAFERMLEENYALESFRLYTHRQPMPQFQMYLRLNRVGRKHLLDPKGSPLRNDWLDALHHVSDSLDCIFYCLSVNPFLCHATKDLESQICIARRANKRRRLNDDGEKQSSENSSSVNSSLSSSENSSSPSSDSENVTRNAPTGEHQVSTSESSNANKNLLSSSTNQPNSSSESNNDHSSTSQQRNDLLGAGGQAQGPNNMGLQQGMQAMASTNQQQQSQSQEPLEQQLQQLQALLQVQQGHQQVPQQAQQQAPPQQPQQQQVPDPNQANALASMALPLLLSQMMQQGQAPHAAQAAPPMEQFQQFMSVASSIPGMSAVLAQMQANPQQFLQGQPQLQQGQDQQLGQSQSHAAVAATVPSNLEAGEPRSSDANAFPLYMPRDKECLSSYQCFLRQQIELFQAGPEDVKSTMPGRNRAIVPGQVGIRCRHCAVLPARYRGTGATYYPAKLDRLYQAAQNMAQTHFTKHCRHIPQEVVNELAVLLQGSKSSAGAGKKYWSDGARLLGAYEDDSILRLDRNRATA